MRTEDLIPASHRLLPSGASGFTCAIALVTAIAGNLHAADAETASNDWVEFHFDDKPHVTGEIAGGLSYGVEFETPVAAEVNYDLDDENNEDEIATKPELSLGLLYEHDKWARAYVEFQLSKEILLKSPDDDNPDWQLSLEKAYLTFMDETRNTALTVGRWSVSDEREWLFDEELDGAQFVWRGENHALEFMYAREELLQKDLLGEHDNDNPDFFLARYYGRPFEDTVASLYLLHAAANDGDADRLTWAGGSLAGELASDIAYWVEGAGVFGEEDGRNVSGFGFDIGATKTFKDVMWEPRLTVAFAFGSGDDGSGTDNAFRQTGLQGNGARFGGRESFQYYGEVFDPELSNLGIVTLGAGVSLTEKTSLDLIYHHYFQHRASDKIRDNSLDERPSGSSRHIGDEFDLVLGIREIENVDVDVVGGVFLPGNAFEDDDDPAFFGELTVTVKF